MAFEILSVPKLILAALGSDQAVQLALGFYGQGDIRNNPRFDLSEANVNSAIFFGVAPLGTIEPFLSYDFFTNTDVNTLGGDRAFQDVSIIAKVSQSGEGYGSIKALADAMDNALVAFPHTTDISVGITVYRFIRETELIVDEIIDNVTWYHLGGVYCTVTSQS